MNSGQDYLNAGRRPKKATKVKKETANTAMNRVRASAMLSTITCAS